MDQAHPPTSQEQGRSADTRELSDKDLVAEVLRKDRKATAEFVARCADSVYGYVRRRLVPRVDLAEDLVQEVFLSAWENLDKYRGDSPLRNWVLGIARHKVEDYYRARLRELQLQEIEESPGSEPAGLFDLEELLARRQTGDRTREILACLPQAYGVILLWRYWERRSLRDIAAQSGKTEKAIERLLARAREQFRKKWNERRFAQER